MLAEIIAIGDELTSGQRLDTNSQWISQQLSDHGVQTVRHQTIADYLTPMMKAFQQAANRADVILVTGGLGPTADDLTRQALAAAFDLELDFDPDSWEHIQQLFKSRNYPLPENNRIQAMFPKRSLVIPNRTGTAPGIDLSVSSTVSTNGVDCSDTQNEDLMKTKTQSRFFCLPGVPAEMKEMFAQTVLPRIIQWQEGQTQVIKRKVIRTFGAGESHVETLLPDLIRRGKDPQVGITASKATISLRIEAKGKTEEECDRKIEPVVTTIEQTLGDLVFGRGDDELEDAVIPMLQKTKNHLVVVEWGTAGRVSQAISQALDSHPSDHDQTGFHYAGSLILNDSQAVRKWLEPDLSVDVSSLDSDDEQTLPKLVQNLCQVAADRFQSDLAVASGPLPSSNPAGTPSANEARFWVVIRRRNEQGDISYYSKSFNVVGHSSIWIPRASKQVLNQLRLLLMGKLEPDSL